MVFHSRLVGTFGTGNIRLLIIKYKLYLDKLWQMSHTNPKVTELLLFRYRIVKSCLDTELAISERVGTGNPCSCLTALSSLGII